MEIISTNEFLKFFSGSVFQTFHDRKNDIQTKSKDEPYCICKLAPKCTHVYSKYDEVLFRNLNANNIGIYMTANFFQGGRTESSLTKLNAVYGDLDIAKENDEQSDEQKLKNKLDLFHALQALSIPPNFITVTKNGLQPLWLINEDKIDVKTKGLFKNVIGGIIVWSKTHSALGDEVKDIPRVLRLPGYNHTKGSPFRVDVWKLQENKTTLQDLATLFPYFDENQIDNDNAKTYTELRGLDDLTMEEVALEALKDYGEPNAYFDKTNRIVLNRGVTGAFLGKMGDKQFIGSTSHELPFGNKITFVRRLLEFLDNKESYSWIKKRFNLANSKQVSQKSGLNVELEDVSEIKLNFNDGDRIFSGYSQLDQHIKGFRSGKIYLITGYKKSGKSTFLSSIASNIMKDNIIGIVNTEELNEEYLARFVAIEKSKKISDVTEEEIELWRNNENIRKNFLYVGKNKLLDEEMLVDVEKCLAFVEKFIEAGAKAIIFDNLTTLAANTEDGFGYTKIARAETRLNNLASTHNITIFFVIHVKPSCVEVSDDPNRVKKFIEDGFPERIFSESLPILIKRPKSSDVYGGGIADATISGGSIFVWRPYQNFFSDPQKNALTSISLNGFRNLDPIEIFMYFMGDQSKFVEKPTSILLETLDKLRNIESEQINIFKDGTSDEDWEIILTVTPKELLAEDFDPSKYTNDQLIKFQDEVNKSLDVKGQVRSTPEFSLLLKNQQIINKYLKI